MQRMGTRVSVVLLNSYQKIMHQKILPEVALEQTHVFSS